MRIHWSYQPPAQVRKVLASRRRKPLSPAEINSVEALFPQQLTH
ncbi:hypothetical protein [Psychromicrobium sp. YIM B11713]